MGPSRGGRGSRLPEGDGGGSSLPGGCAWVAWGLQDAQGDGAPSLPRSGRIFTAASSLAAMSGAACCAWACWVAASFVIACLVFLADAARLTSAGDAAPFFTPSLAPFFVATSGESFLELLRNLSGTGNVPNLLCRTKTP